MEQAPTKKPLPEGRCFAVNSARGIREHFLTWVGNGGWIQAVHTALKVLSGRRIYYVTVLDDGRMAQSGWANLGFCRYYPVEPDAVVLGTLLVHPELRSRGFATSAKSHVMHYLYEQGYRRFYADTSPANRAAQLTSEKLGFERINSISIASEAS